MSVTSITELWRGRGGSQNSSANGKSTRRFRAVTDSPYDDDGTVGVAFQAWWGSAVMYSPHPTRPNLWVVDVDIFNEDPSSLLWLITVQYGSELPAENQFQTNPTDRATNDWWEHTRYQVPSLMAYPIDDDGNEGDLAQILNSAGDAFDPPHEKDGTRLTIFLTWFVDTVPDWAPFYQDVVNEDDVNYRGQTCPAGTLKCNVKPSPFRIVNGYSVREMTATVEFREEGWNAVLLDRGYSYRRKGKSTPIMKNGDKVSQPALLDGEGYPLGIRYDGAIGVGTPNLVIATPGFVAGDAGAQIVVSNAGAGGTGHDLETTILTYGSSTSVTLATNAGATASNTQVTWIPSRAYYRTYREYVKKPFNGYLPFPSSGY